MNPSFWIETFQANRHRFVEPGFAKSLTPLREPIRVPLAKSLAVFQLGETGGGTRLQRYVRQVIPASHLTGYEEAVRLFVAEEQYHASLLAKLVDHLGGELLHQHWTNGIFRWVRNLFGLGFNIQVLLTAELIAEVYYGVLYRRVEDPVVKACCRKILKDEMRHIAFHTDFFRELLSSRSWIQRWLWGRQFAFCLETTLRIVAWDHREILTALGMPPSDFRALARKAGRRFLRRLRSQPLGMVTEQSRKTPQLAARG